MRQHRCFTCGKSLDIDHAMLIDFKRKLTFCSDACCKAGEAFLAIDEQLHTEREALARQAFEEMDATARRILGEDDEGKDR